MKFNFKIFRISAGLLSFLTLISVYGAAAVDEGSQGKMVNILNSLFLVLRFPTHPLFWDFIIHGKLNFFGGLIINVILYSFAIERLFYLYRKIKTNGDTKAAQNDTNSLQK
jgi:hypothetical protein